MSSNTRFKIALLFQWGQLGNQLFQYCVAQQLVPPGRVLLVGMHSLKSFVTIQTLDATNRLGILSASMLARIGRNRVIGFCQSTRLFSIASERRDKTGMRSYIHIRSGIVPWIVLVDGFFQDEQLATSQAARLAIADRKLLLSMQSWMAEESDGRDAKRWFFIHIRRGDYLNWPSADAPAVLPMKWIRDQVLLLRAGDPCSHFLVCSNDIHYAIDALSDIDGITFCHGSAIEDLMVMTSCQGGGVLSPSSFSWWAAFFSHNENPEARFIAPLFWAGWRRRKWYPSGIRTSWIQYVDVRDPYSETALAKNN